MNAAFSVDPASPFEAQAEIALAISGYVTEQEQAFAHANCMTLLAYTQDPDTQVFLQSCLIALRHRMSFGAFSRLAPEPTAAIDAVPASPLREQAGASSP